MRDNPTVRETVPTLNANFFSEPTPNGLYDYKLVLPSGPINGIRVSVAEVNVTVTGLTLVKKKKKCTKRKRGKCVKRKTKTKRTLLVHRADLPAQRECSASRRSTATTTEPGRARRDRVPCPKFR